MKKKLLTLEDLVKFCREQKLFSFSKQDNNGEPICVAVPATFKQEEKEDSSLLYAVVKAFHTGVNRNDSNVTVDAAKNSLSTFAYKPILAAFTTDSNGDEDFMAHEMELDEDGNVVYIEQQVGCFTVDEPWMEKDSEHEDREYIFAKCAIPREYTHAASIIERKGGTKVSVELIVNKFSYDEDTDVLLLEDIEVSGLTLLGVYEEGADPDNGGAVEEGMAGARLDIADFSKEKNSSINYAELKDVIKEAVVQTLSDINKSKEGGKKMKFSQEKLNELLEKYAVKSEDITFDLEAIESDEELEKAFEAQFSNPSSDPAQEEKKVEMSVKLGESVRDFAKSLTDEIYALTDLVNATYSEDGTYYMCEVFDGGTAKSRYVIMVDMFGSKAYKQGFTIKDGVYALKNEREEVFAEWLTASEREQLDSIRSNYASMEEKLGEAAKELELYKAEPEKVELLNSADYDSIKDSAEFAEIAKRDNYFSLTKEELETKLDGMMAEFAKKQSREAKKNEKSTVGEKRFGFGTPDSGSGRYGGIFEKTE